MIQISSKDEFDAIEDDNELIILNTGEHIVSSVEDIEGNVAVYWIFTTRNFCNSLQNAILEEKNTGKSCNFSIDVTFNLTNEEYNLGLLGCIVPVIRSSDNFVLYQFVPFFGFICKSEAEVVYNGVFSTAKEWTKTLFDEELNIKYITQDHCRASANAAINNFPGIALNFYNNFC